MASRSEWVSVEVTRFALPALAVRPRPALLDPVVRAGVLIDLALLGALVDTGNGLEVDTGPSGFALADRLLGAVVDRPDKPLLWWLYHAPISVQDIAVELIAQGEWERHGPLRHYRDQHPQRTANARNNLIADARRSCTPAQAATATLLDLLPLPRQRNGLSGAAVLDSYGPARWIVPDLEAELQRRQAIVEAAGRDARNAQSATFII